MVIDEEIFPPLQIKKKKKKTQTKNCQEITNED